MKYYAIHFNRPDLVEVQFNLAKKIGYDLVIVNNGRNPEIKEVSNNLGVEYIETNNIGYASISHGNSINQIKHLIDYSKDWGLIDHDMFIVENIDFGEYDIIGHSCDNVPDKPYLWPAIMICKGGINLSEIDFRPGIGICGDTGCDTYRIMNKYKIKILKQSYINENSESINLPENIQNVTTFGVHKLDEKIIAYHYFNASNWTGQNKTSDKNDMIKRLLY